MEALSQIGLLWEAWGKHRFQVPVVGAGRLTSVWEVNRAAKASVPSPGSPTCLHFFVLLYLLPARLPLSGSIQIKEGGTNVTIIPVSHCHLGDKVLIPNQLFGLSA